ncbi:hypothetical protein [Staphylococcus simiae]|uniref:Uncharacterized protein n=1 Tax=Staphylococcus simiae CCM 7213 = CCUG 51256 TaxID=911238 RepID=G5JH82_9STAP|nr:hypothetical protein [Staphylococcus simiae]EHJ08430.1 hypothetical protein SS7213T_04055 [Staphylococcus simiae CCM 7213 = CCUG 51256]PNZ12536.1 hypothetical protein CD113_06480 [Staphylococcus simiae]SNV67275.1 Uncharacterised protein [Staphylococcus simiae]
MVKFLYALLIIIIFLIGLISALYGLYIIWKPLAYIIGGTLLVLISIVLNQNYDHPPNKGGGS